MWDDALAGPVEIEATACIYHTVSPTFRVDSRVWDQHICNLITDQAVTVEANGRRRTIPAGGAVWIGSGVEHTFALARPGQPFAMLNLRFRLRHLGRPLQLPEGVLLVDDAWDLRPLWEMAIDDQQRQRADRTARLRHILALLHGDLARRDHGDHGDEGAGLGRRRRLALLAWTAKHLHERPTPGDLAAVVGLSEDWFRRAFQRSFALSPRAWLTRERVRRAAQRLTEDPQLAVAEVARQLGYADHRLLDRQFLAVMGVTPGRWRRG